MISQDLASQTAARLKYEDRLYKQVALKLSELIEHGTLRPGERVPSVRKCSAQQDVRIATVMQGYVLATGPQLWECAGLTENVVSSPVYYDGLAISGNSYYSQAMLAIRLAGAKGDIISASPAVADREIYFRG